MAHRQGLSTQAVHSGEDKIKPYYSLTTPIVQTSTYVFEDTAAVIEHMQRKEEPSPPPRGEYGRYGNPTQATVERKLAELDGGEKALVFSSGMAAVTTALLSLLSEGSHLIITDDCYHRTRSFCTQFLSRFGVETSVVPVGDYKALEDAINPRTRLFFSELPTNPYLRCLNMERVVEIGRRHSVLIMMDSTLATPYNLRPLEWGADIVLHSGTKYLAGHNDILCGALVGSPEFLEPIKETQASLGGVPSPQNAYLLLRGLKTLGVRLPKQNANGQAVAEYLETRPEIAKVWYPGLPSHPDHGIAARQMRGFGGVVTFEIKGNLETAGRLIDELQMPYIGPSFGGVESLVEQPALMSHFALGPEEREAVGIKDTLIRYSLGIEDAEDLIADLAQALDKIEATRE
ncbi:MAG: aminotransferase class I/II-fold pyridoxal phosphate-dependent enzyme [Chloroflexota bacterium]|nr:aminotransferase class I/II-fold pyridoxal phosphate-dependent enzyme [Chloroflexota bacterium]